MKKKNLIILIATIFIILVVIMGIRLLSGEDSWICENGQWVKHGSPSAPMPISGCGNDPVGMRPQENLEIQQKYPSSDKIKITSLKANELIKSPLEIEGQARGTWYFEASFPIRVEDEKGNLLGNGNANAQGEWMTEDFVPFHAVVIFNAKENKSGFLVFKKDNPSDLEENDESVKIPVKF